MDEPNKIYEKQAFLPHIPTFPFIIIKYACQNAYYYDVNKMSPKSWEKDFCKVFSIKKNANWIKKRHITSEFYKALKNKKIKSDFSKNKNQ